MLDARSGLLGGQVRSYLADGVARLDSVVDWAGVPSFVSCWCLGVVVPPFPSRLAVRGLRKGMLRIDVLCDLDYAGREIVSIK